MSPRGWKGFLGLLLLGALAVVFTTTGPAAGRGSAAAPPDGPGSGRWQRLGSSPLTAPTTPPAILTPTSTPIPWDDILVSQDSSSGGETSNESLAVHGPYVYVVVDFSPGDEVRFIRSADGGWTFEPSRLLATPGFLSSLFMRPGAGQNGADALYVVFQNNDQRVYCVQSLDGGATWSAPALVRQGQGHWPDLAKVVVDDAGVLYVAWYEDVDDYGGYFYVSSSTDGGITFSPPVQVNPERRQFLRTWAAYTLAPWQNTLYFAYVDLPPTPGFNIMFTRSTDGGQTWSAPVRVDDSGISDKYGVDLAVDAAGVLYVAWDDNREYGGGHLLTRVARSTDGGATWSPGVRVDDAGDCVEGSTSGAIAVDAGTVSLHVALWDGRNYCREPYYLGWDDVFYTCSTDGGRTWSRNEQISNPVPYNIIWFPSIQTWDGVVYTLFSGHGAGWLWLDIHDPHLPPVTMTPTPTPMDTPVPTATPTPTNTPPPTSTPRPTVTAAPSATPTATPRPTVPATPTATATPSPSPGPPGWRVCLPWVERR